MKARKWRRRHVAALGGFLTVAAAAAGIALRHSNDIVARPPAERPELLLLTSLPIMFPEEFTLSEAGSPALDALQSHYRVVPISIADRQSLDSHRLLLMAQPRAQPAEALVELDEWVRSGGRVLLLADPALEWPSNRPLGDASRPPPAFADTGLLSHWGLRLDAPDRLGPASFEVDGQDVHALSPGTLVRSAGDCTLAAGGLVARCALGRGRATIVADADFADVERRREPARSGNLRLLLSELERLETDSAESRRAQTYPQALKGEQEKNRPRN